MCAVVEGRDAVVFPVGMTLFKVLLPARIQSSNGLKTQREKTTRQKTKSHIWLARRLLSTTFPIYYIPWTGLDSCWAGSDPTLWNRSQSEPRERPDTGSNRYKSVLYVQNGKIKLKTPPKIKHFPHQKPFSYTTRRRGRRRRWEGIVDLCVHQVPPFIQAESLFQVE